jgi:hypothetical protein
MAIIEIRCKFAGCDFGDGMYVLKMLWVGSRIKESIDDNLGLLEYMKYGFDSSPYSNSTPKAKLVVIK